MSSLPNVGKMKRIYEELLREHFAEERQMAFVSGPRQVGKSTLIDSLCSKNDIALNWDRPDDRRAILKGSDFIIEQYGIMDLSAVNSRRLVAFDEIHKFRQWKNFLKGFFDASEGVAAVLVTGSARLNIYKRGGDSLMGRYFLYRIHPLSIGELIARPYDASVIRNPVYYPMRHLRDFIDLEVSLSHICVERIVFTIDG